jgi:hypothetical protein
MLEKLNFIKTTFNLTKNELKIILNVETFKQIDKNDLQLFKLYCLAKNWRELGFPNERKLLFKKIMNVESVFDNILKDMDNEKILFYERFLLREENVKGKNQSKLY